MTLVVSRRVNILVQVADFWARERGYDPMRNARGLARYWAEAPAAERIELAVAHGVRPDPILLRQFVEALEGRADRVAAGGSV